MNSPSSSRNNFLINGGNRIEFDGVVFYWKAKKKISYFYSELNV